MDDGRKSLFTNGHNVRRDILSRGELPGVFQNKEAVDMARMVSKPSIVLS